MKLKITQDFDTKYIRWLPYDGGFYNDEKGTYHAIQSFVDIEILFNKEYLEELNVYISRITDFDGYYFCKNNQNKLCITVFTSPINKRNKIQCPK